VDGVVAVERPGQGVALVEFEGVAGLRVDVDADHVEPGPVVAHGRAAGAAEQVEQARPHRL
jgi:hypothetical protein